MTKFDQLIDRSFTSNKRAFIKQLEDSGSSLRQRVISVDNRLIELFFSNFEGLYKEEEQIENPELQEKIEDIYFIIETMLPEIEKQVIILFFFLKKKQETIGKILNISQEMVCYYKNRAVTRIRLLHFFRNVDINDMEIFLEEYVTKKQKIAMLEYFKDHDLRRVAEKVTLIEKRKKKIVYESIGSRIKLGIKKLKSLSKNENKEIAEKALMYYHIFTSLKKYNSLHHTQSKKSVSLDIIA